ncbi:TonB-dependent receptor plug domain-containing protein [Leptothrix discophora]|uniref:TonB-dependent receptor plug domain-containing protein n=1 Tax=Leptothrix discophora TaxID=89 RepID=A0ABT9G2J7_LEPDI|nr:TonB-dependent receptor plug domain-containing protein [Leptothrix discophora]MDP4300497.1 TonB-dependent receptor plug domain-containing protein [Leptothrix discophora]
MAACAADELPAAPTATLPRVEIPASRAASAAIDPPGWASPATAARATTVLDPAESPTADRLADLLRGAPGLQPVVSDGGLSTQFNLRGFIVTRLQYDGLPEVTRLFTRDPSTLAAVRVQGGPSGVDSGLGSPGGSVTLAAPTPGPLARRTVSLQGGSSAWRRGVLDLNQPLTESWRARLIVAAQDGRSDPGRQVLARDNLLASLAWHDPDADGLGMLRVDSEVQHNHQPYLFGTVMSQTGAVRYGQLYASPDQRSDRRTTRQALHWQVDRWLGRDGQDSTSHDSTSQDSMWQAGLRLDLGRARVLRDETLIGAWAQRSDGLLDGYYTRLHDDHLQRAGRLEGRLTRTGDAWQLDSRIGTETAHRLTRFSGVQNIGGYQIDPQQPDFSQVDPARLTLGPRLKRQDDHERSRWLRQSVGWSNAVMLQAGLREVRHDSRAGIGLATTSRGRDTVQEWAVATQPQPGWLWSASRSQGLELNAGLTRSGDFLPPQRSLQHELALALHPGAIDPMRPGTPWLRLALFRIDLSGLPRPDPADRTAFIADGARRVDGFEAVTDWQGGAWQGGAWQLQGQLGLLRARTLTPVSPTQRDWPGNTSRRSAALRLQGDLGRLQAEPATPLQAWVQGVARSSAYVDAANTVRLPGSVITDAGLSGRVERWRWSLAIRNLFDLDHVAHAASVDEVYQGTPRQLRLVLASPW